MSWTYDAAAGVYKDHAMSSKIRQAAVADSQFMRFFSPESGYGKGRGASVTITRFHNLPIASRVSEQDRLPTGKPQVTTKQLSVSEWGYKVQMTEFEENLTHFDLKNRTQRALRDQMRLTLDVMCSTALKTTPMKMSVAGSTLTLNTAGTIGTSSTNMTVDFLGEIFDIMYGDGKVPAWKNGRYVGIISPKVARGLKNDGDFQTWWSRNSGGLSEIQKGNNMLPDIQGFDLYVTNNYDALDNTIGSATTGEAIFFGEDAGFLATVQEPELRAGPKEDLGRFSDVGWVGTIEAGLVWDIASQARVYHWASTG